MDDIKPLGELEMWNRPAPGHVAPWVRVVVALAAVLGIVVVGAAAWNLWRMGGWSLRHDSHADHFVMLPMFVMAMLLVITWFPDGSVSRFVRLAVALPVIHAAALVVALFYVPSLETKIGDRTPMMASMPVELWFGLGLLLFVVLGRLIGGRREWAHAFVMLALSFLLLLGLWLPIAAWFPAKLDAYGYWAIATRRELERNPELIAAAMLVPPLLIATLYTLCSVRMPRLARAGWLPIAILLSVLFVASSGARVLANNGAFLVHDNFIHLLLASVAIAIVSMVVLAASTWLVGRRTQVGLRAQARDGAISDDDSDVVACLQITSWLRGPRLWMRSFVANTSNELLLVPSGATLATELPKISSGMRIGEAVVVLNKRDAITLGGFVEREVGDSPFRAAKMTVPGPSGITVGRREPMSTPIETMLLTAWRPAVAYLLILIAIVVPSLIGLVVDGEP